MAKAGIRKRINRRAGRYEFDTLDFIYCSKRGDFTHNDA
jgi:hypothetical protein